MVLLYRVSDADAQAKRHPGQGIVTIEDMQVEVRPFLDWRKCTPREYRKYAELLYEHMDWQSDAMSPFISATRDYNWARGEARRRVEQGNQDVVIYHIETKISSGNVQFRPILSLLERLGIEEDELNYGAQALLDHECLFLHQIPEESIVRTEHFRSL
ncbi:hypothetical protein VFPPC_17892 [Pochonia chlamydosporia 170]|uniref:DUF7587 domain-containing protein n=1 Tax=Pochonia chlamydosporia 170 TaxID=1380566 RepID=A0A219ARS6_METCM|nr:hypothetical protein VFPPC_17892 [Pochonia chlamydosporia 170]OWT42915.1 hypothetical protein VFPPC_17892 [Pochonia chlamydosporia 170]